MDGGPSDESLAKHVEKATLRPGIELVAMDELDLEGTLRAHTNECFAPIDAAQRDALSARRGEDELYVVLPQAKVKDTQIWRLDPEGQLVKVMSKRIVAPTHAEPMSVVDVEADTALYTQLAAHPNECVPEVDAAAIEQVEGMVPATGLAYVRMTVGKHELKWRWDRESRRLAKVIEP